MRQISWSQSAINRVGRAADGGDVQDLQVQFEQREGERVRAGDGLVVIRLQAGPGSNS